MMKITFDTDNNRQPIKILCLGAHSDDLEIGCGGTVLKLLNKYSHLEIYWVVFSSDPIRSNEALTSASDLLSETTDKTIIIKEFQESYFPYIGKEIKNYFEELKKQFIPDLIFTHRRDDMHQDHRLISELTWNTYRNHLIFEYEIPKYEGDLGSPNLYVHLDQVLSDRKVQLIHQHFKSQAARQWFSQDTFWAVLKLRGIESNSPSGYAEGFYCRKIVF
jgi:LmbE family N-acetylglucosaminyl deacetylase